MTGTIGALDLPFDEAVEFLRGKANVTTKHWHDVYAAAHSRMFMVAGASTDALVADFRAAVDKAIANGITIEDFRADFDAIVAKHGWDHTGSRNWRSKIIFDTNLRNAYAAGRYAQMVEPETLAAFPYWQYHHSGSLHPRKEHLMWDGMVLRADDPFWATNYPPNGWRCGCYVTSLSERDLRRQGKSGPDETPDLVFRAEEVGGRKVSVPFGVDPGFEYNPGQAWAVHRLDGQLHRSQSEWVQSLTSAERKAIADYKGVRGFLFNERLRGAEHDTGLDPSIKTLIAALSRARLPQDAKVWRGVPRQNLLQVGDIDTTLGFLSSSINREIAEGMAGNSGTLFEFVVPKNFRAAYINHIPWASFDGEYELILPPGTRLKVISVEGNLIRAEVVDAN